MSGILQIQFGGGEGVGCILVGPGSFSNLHRIHCLVQLERRLIIARDRVKDRVPTCGFSIGAAGQQGVMGIYVFDHALGFVVERKFW